MKKTTTKSIHNDFYVAFKESLINVFGTQMFTTRDIRSAISQKPGKFKRAIRINRENSRTTLYKHPSRFLFQFNDRLHKTLSEMVRLGYIFEESKWWNESKTKSITFYRATKSSNYRKNR